MNITRIVTEQFMPPPIPVNSIAKGVPPAAVLRMLSQHSREEIAGFITVAIGLLDLADGDPEAEDACDLEGDFTFSDMARYFMPNSLAGHEDDEDDAPTEEDDPSGQCDEDEVNTGYDLVRYTRGASGPGCPLADPGECIRDGIE